MYIMKEPPTMVVLSTDIITDEWVSPLPSITCVILRTKHHKYIMDVHHNDVHQVVHFIGMVVNLPILHDVDTDLNEETGELTFTLTTI